MSQQNQITPTTELINDWIAEANRQDCVPYTISIATQAAQWAADTELETILEMVGVGQQSLPEEDRYLDGFTVASIRAARRPTPPSLKQSALHELNDVYNRDKIDDSTYDTIRRALEQL